MEQSEKVLRNLELERLYCEGERLREKVQGIDQRIRAIESEVIIKGLGLKLKGEFPGTDWRVSGAKFLPMYGKKYPVIYLQRIRKGKKQFRKLNVWRELQYETATLIKRKIYGE